MAVRKTRSAGNFLVFVGGVEVGDADIADGVRSYVVFWGPAFAGMTQRNVNYPRHSRECGSPKDSCSYAGADL